MNGLKLGVTTQTGIEGNTTGQCWLLAKTPNGWKHHLLLDEVYNDGEPIAANTLLFLNTCERGWFVELIPGTT